ncbi:hypothetical protein KSP39_PZI007189 [Platanthera zijinensis]|uniref:Uncharacterized protein n=1 Tax=Platanthera zijinensis TaxID=2320716 RepID=A0AAP0BQK4_9ASPA
MEEKDSRVNGEKTKNIVTSLLRKNSENHVTTSSSASLSSPLPSISQDLPDFFTCHGCGLRDGGLQTLHSQWRVVLVCQGCHGRIRSAAVCSYCFNTRDVDVLVCRSCLCRVHLSCVHIQRGYITLSEFDPVSFTCIDCCAMPRPQFQNPRRYRALLENLVRNVSSAAKKKSVLAAGARLKALKKADDARVAMELAFDAILSARDASAADENLAMQLHQVMNGSPRIVRRRRLSNSGNLLPAKEDCCNGSVRSMGRKPGNWRRRKVHEKVGVCRKDDAVFESNSTSLLDRKSSIKPRIADAHCASGSKEETMGMNGQQFDVILNCDEAVNHDGLALISCRESADSNSLVEVSECGTGPGDDSPNLQEECTVPCCGVKLLQDEF